MTYVERLDIRNFQSLRGVSLHLGRLTVVVGPSSSGKTGLIRALKILASNAQGSAFVTHGEKLAVISAQTDHGLVTLEKGAGHGVYRVVGIGITEDDYGDVEETYSKLGGKVPPEVSQVLGIDPVTSQGSVHFAGQFDRPYLLDSTGSTVAEVLGKLTNVDVIFAAVKEANRRKGQVGSRLKTREADLAEVRARVGSYAGLPAAVKACTAAEEKLRAVEELGRRSALLAAAIAELETARAVLERHTLPVVPDLRAMVRKQAYLAAVRDQVRDWAVARKVLAGAEKREEQARTTAATAEKDFHDRLAAAGRCPTCQQEVSA